MNYETLLKKLKKTKESIKQYLIEKLKKDYFEQKRITELDLPFKIDPNSPKNNWLNHEKIIKKKYEKIITEPGRIPNPFEEEKLRLRAFKNSLLFSPIMDKTSQHDSPDLFIYPENKDLKYNFFKKSRIEKLADLREIENSIEKRTEFPDLFPKPKVALTAEQEREEKEIQAILAKRFDENLYAEMPLLRILEDYLSKKIWGRRFPNFALTQFFWR